MALTLRNFFGMLALAAVLAVSIFIAAPRQGSFIFPRHVAASCTPNTGWILYKVNSQWVHVFDNNQQKYTNVDFQLMAYQDCTLYNYQLRTYTWVEDGSYAYHDDTNHGEICYGSTCQTYHDVGNVVCQSSVACWAWENGYISLYPGNWGHGADDWGPGYDGDLITYAGSAAFSPHWPSLYMTISVP